MKYRPLLNYAYAKADEEKYQELFHNRFYFPDTLHFNLNVSGNPTFVYPTAEIWELIYTIQSCNAKVELLTKSGILPDAAINQFTTRCLVDEIILTNDIEGVNSTRREIQDVLEKLQTSEKKKMRFEGLVSKYLYFRTGKNVPLQTCQDIRDLYDELVAPEVLEEDANDALDGMLFRKNSVSVANAAQKEIHRGVMPESEIIQMMERALFLLHDDSINIFIRVSVFHYIFGYIHPFYNGNGRLSRFISGYILSKELNPLIGYRLSYTIKENLASYYRGFKDCNEPRNKGDLTSFVIRFLEIVAEAMEQLLQALETRKEELLVYNKMIEKIPGLTEKHENLVFLILQATLFSSQGISMKELQVYEKASPTTIRSRLAFLEQNHLLEIHKDGREKLYKLNLQQMRLLTGADS